jgi:hypothetical protein
MTVPVASINRTHFAQIHLWIILVITCDHPARALAVSTPVHRHQPPQRQQGFSNVRSTLRWRAEHPQQMTRARGIFDALELEAVLFDGIQAEEICLPADCENQIIIGNH